MANIFDYFFKRNNECSNDETATINMLIRFPSESEIQNASQNLNTIVKCEAPQWAKEQYINKRKYHFEEQPPQSIQIIEYNFIKHKNNRDEFIKKYFLSTDVLLVSFRNKIV